MVLRVSFSLLLALFSAYGVQSAIFTVKNNCKFVIWPGILTGVGAPVLSGFELAPGAVRTLSIASPWSGRVWARYKCLNTNGTFVCESADCAAKQILCKNAGGIPPATLVEFTLAGADQKDFFDISLVDGFNLPVAITPDRGNCRRSTCPADVNSACPAELAIKGSGGGVIGCKSACVAFNQPQYCCTGAFGTPTTCRPTNYSRIFKRLCSDAYSYAYDDKTSTFTCPTGANYDITFCPRN